MERLEEERFPLPLFVGVRSDQHVQVHALAILSKAGHITQATSDQVQVASMRVLGRLGQVSWSICSLRSLRTPDPILLAIDPARGDFRFLDADVAEMSGDAFKRVSAMPFADGDGGPVWTVTGAAASRAGDFSL